MASLESFIQSEIVRHLRRLGYVVYSTPNEGAGGNPVRTGQLVTMGLLPGVADLTVWIGNGRVAYLEVKAEHGVQSEHQRLFQKRCEQSGYPYFVVRSVEEAVKCLENEKST